MACQQKVMYENLTYGSGWVRLPPGSQMADTQWTRHRVGSYSWPVGWQINSLFDSKDLTFVKYLAGFLGNPFPNKVVQGHGHNRTQKA